MRPVSLRSCHSHRALDRSFSSPARPWPPFPRRRTALAGLAAIAFLGLGTSPVRPQTTLTFQQGAGGYDGGADCTLRAGSVSPDDSELVVIDGDITNRLCDPTAGCPKIGLLRFGGIIGFGPGRIPPGAAILSAVLKVTVPSACTGGVTTSVHRVLQPWSELDTWDDWNNGVHADGVEAEVAPDAVVPPVTQSGQVTIDVTESLAAWMAAPNHGWALIPDQNDDGWCFKSSESPEVESRPVLEVTFLPAKSALACSETPTVISPSPSTLDNFSVIDIDGTTLAVGSPNEGNAGGCCGDAAGIGAVYVFERVGGDWTHVATLTPSDGARDDEFGASVAIQGARIVVGSPRHAGLAGAVYVFEKPEAGWSDATETWKLTGSSAVPDDHFGVDVALDGDSIAIGALNDNTQGSDAGAAYVFELKGDTWVETKLFGTTTVAGSRFGVSVSIRGDVLAVGADEHVVGTGSVYVFRSDEGGWVEQAVLEPSDPELRDFGFSISLAADATAILVGAYDPPRSGSAYVFEEAGGLWTQVAELSASDGQGGDFFGVRVVLGDGFALIGAPGDDDVGGADQGSAYLFLKPEGGWADRFEDAKLLAAGGTEGDRNGSHVAVSGGTLVLGATRAAVLTGGSLVEEAGAVHVFECALPDITPAASFSFSGPDELRCPAGTSETFEVLVRIAALKELHGWSLSLRASGCEIIDATTAGTAADGALFADTQVVSCEGESAAISGIALDVENGEGLEPGEHVVLRLTVRATFPATEDCSPCVLSFHDGCQGSGQPVDNTVTVIDESTGHSVTRRDVETAEHTVNLCAYLCPEAGDTRIESISVEPPEGPPGTFTATATASDESGDPVSIELWAEKDDGSLALPISQDGAQAVFDLGPGEWTICARADDDPKCPDELAEATACMAVLVGHPRLPGDCNQDSTRDISDAICVLGYLFQGQPASLPCDDGSRVAAANLDLLDWNGDREIDLSDAVGALRFLFGDGPPHVAGVACIRIPGCNEAACAE